MTNSTNVPIETSPHRDRQAPWSRVSPIISDDLMARIREVLEETPDVNEERVRQALEHWSTGGADAQQIAGRIIELHVLAAHS